MKRLKLMHVYHDAVIREIRYRDNTDVIIDVELCGCCNPTVGPVSLMFLGLRNFTEVKHALESTRMMNAGRACIDEVIGILRHEVRGYLLD